MIVCVCVPCRKKASNNKDGLSIIKCDLQVFKEKCVCVCVE